MKLNSLIDNIRDSIITGLGKKVSVSDRSLLNVLISDYDRGLPADTSAQDAGNGFLGKVRKTLRYCLVPSGGDKFPFSRLAVRVLLLLTFLPLFAVYVLIWLVELLFGRGVSLFRVMRSPRTNMLISLSILVGGITLVVSMIVFFINDVMLYAPQRDINPKGALTITQPCHREHSIFMFNSATLWADTGIDLVEGDVVTISGSGSFDSSIWDKNVKAKNNASPQYSLINIAYDHRNSVKGMESDTRFCLFNDTTDKDNLPRFGSLLYQIRPSRRQCVYLNTDTFSPIRQAKIDEAVGVLDENFTVRESGTLFVCVNDIYLTPEIVDSMFYRRPDSVLCIKPEARSALELYVNDSNGSVFSADSLYKKLRVLAETPEGRANWLYDNCGDILLSIRVERNIWTGSTLGPTDKIYSCVFRGLENVFFPSSNILRTMIIMGLCILAWLIFDRCAGLALRYKSTKNNKHGIR